MGLPLCEPYACDHLHFTTPFQPADIEALTNFAEATNLNDDTVIDDHGPCDCALAEDGNCSCEFQCRCHYCGQCSFGEFWDCEDCCGNRHCHCHNEAAIAIAHANLTHSDAEYPLHPELELASLEANPEFISHGYLPFISNAETVELQGRLISAAWSYYRREGGPLAERLQTLRHWVRDLPNDNSSAMIMGIVGFWQDAQELDSQTSGIGWGESGLQHPLPWLRDLVAPMRAHIEVALHGIEAETVQEL